MTFRTLFGCTRALVLAAVVVSCNSSSSGTKSDGGGDNGDVSSEVAGGSEAGGGHDSAQDASNADACIPTITGCSGLCGPVRDHCGVMFECGGCPTGQVCDLTAHTCGVPKVDCKDLHAECGLTRNSCGTRLDCGPCGNGKECNPDTNTCRDCTAVTCQDIGYECGKAWLGCGPTSNTTDCGKCPDDKVCNPYFHICNPKCTPAPVMDLCTKVAAECGNISDGCGGLVNCGKCAAGKACGALGIANRCGDFETPPECIALNIHCGQIDSGCGGAKIDCGSCPMGQVCNANGVCGAPCVPKKCDAFAPAECGAFDDGCKGTLSCTCPAGKPVCKKDQTCCERKTCTKDYPGLCGTGLDDGCGGTMDCNVCKAGAGEVCTTDTAGMTGTCCTNANQCAAESCASITNSCNGAPVTCACPKAEVCMPNKTCCVKKTCADDYTDMCGTQLDDGCGGKMNCITCKGGQVCDAKAAGMTGMCCTNTNECAPGSCAAITNSCNGAALNCPCGSGEVCKSDNTCCLKKTCSANYAGQCGIDLDDGCGGKINCNNCPDDDVCTETAPGMTGTCCTNVNQCTPGSCASIVNSCNGAMVPCGCPIGQVCKSDTTCCTKKTCANEYGGVCGTDLDDGCGGTLSCGCGSGVCVSGGVTPPAGTGGVCCVNTAACTPGACNTSVVDTCTGAQIDCTCAVGQYCDAGNKTCVDKSTCKSLGKTGAIGSACNDNAFYDDGSGNKMPCACSTGGGKGNNVCDGDSAGAEGTCQCAPSVCGGDCTKNGTSDGCGNVLDCSCGGSDLCAPATHKCCTPKTCSDLPSGAAAGSCGGFQDGCGGTFTCACDTNNKPNNKCVIPSGKDFGSCDCMPKTCVQLGGPGVYENDGCGNPVNCGA